MSVIVVLGAFKVVILCRGM